MIYTFGDCELDTRRCELRVAGETRHVERQVFDVLAYLLEHRDRLVPPEELLDAVWRHRFVTPATLNSRIKSARQAVGDDGTSQRVIRTVRGRGFRVVAPVEVRPDDREPVDVTHASAGAAPEPAVGMTPTPLPPPSAPPSIAPQPFASSLAGAPASLIGRERERALLGARWRAALDGTRQIVFVTGQAGVGKSALIDDFVARVGASDVPVWAGRGQCLDHRGAGEPYMPVLEALGRLCRGPGGEELVELLGRHAPTWLAQMPSLLAPERLAALERLALGATRERMLREMVEAVEMIAAIRPVVLVLEDLHWSDPSTLDLIASLARRPEPARLMLLATWRPGEGAEDVATIAADVQRSGRGVILSPGAWAESDVRAYLDRRLPAGPAPAGLAALLLERTGGNPLFVSLLLDSWIEDGALIEGPDGWRLDRPLSQLSVGIPETLGAIVGRQLETLSPEDRAILEAASVNGLEFAIAAVAAALGEEEEHVEGRCAALARHGTVLRAAPATEWPDGTFTACFAFAHPLYPEVIYDGIPVTRRARLHRDTGLRLEAGYGAVASHHAGELALHFRRARMDEQATHYLWLAAKRALSRSAHAEAIGHLTAALDILRRRPDLRDAARMDLTLQRAYASALLVTRGWGDPDAEIAYARARELAARLDDSTALAKVLYGLAYIHELRGNYADAQAILEERLGVVEPGGAATLVVESHELLSCSLFHQGEFAPALEHARHAASFAASATGDGDTLVPGFGDDAVVASHYWQGTALWFLGHPDSARDAVRRSIELARRSSFHYALAAAEWQAARIHHFRREPETAAEHAISALRIAERHGYPYPRALAWSIRGWTEVLAGEVDAGLTELRRGLAEQDAAGAAMERPYCLALLAEGLLIAGRDDEAAAVLDEAFDHLTSGRAFFWEAELHRLRGELRRRAGDRNAAVEHTTVALDVAERQGARSLMLRAAAALTRLQRGTAAGRAARDRLGAILADFTEGFDAPDFRDAAALIESCKRTLGPTAVHGSNL